MINIDLDDVLTDFNPKCIYEAFKHNINEWDVLTSNCIGRYYDIWALRMSENVWKPEIHNLIWDKPLNHDCWHEITDNTEAKICVKNYQKVIPVDSPLIETDSSFGGLGIYKLSKLGNCIYNGYIYDNLGNIIRSQCEHVALHHDIKKNGGRIFICPSLVVKSQKEHLIC